MSEAAWMAQEVPSMGAISAEGIKRTIATSLSQRTVFVREAAQNSWDAGRPDRVGPVRFDISYLTLTDAQRETWRDLLGQPDAKGRPSPIGEVLDDSTFPLIVVSDRNTCGLGGPTRAGNAAGDYISFALNVGDPRDTAFGGGTYGFGKAALFNMSRASTILAFSSSVEPAEHRLVGIALGSSVRSPTGSLTGRYWWGNVDGDHADPLQGAEAEAVAGALGLPAFRSGETGTTIAIPAPVLGGDEPRDLMEWIAEAVRLHLWPKRVALDQWPDMEVTVHLDGEDLTPPAPDDDPLLKDFATAMREHAGGGGAEIAGPAARQRLGRMAVARRFGVPPRLTSVAQEAGLVDSLHHACLVRRANLVVQYLAGPPLAEPSSWYAAFFQPLEDLDHTFAESEPPAHDQWLPEEAGPEGKRIIRATMRHLGAHLREIAAPAPATDAENAVDHAPLGRLSAALAPLLGAPSTGTAGSGGGGTTPSSSGRPSRRRITLAGGPLWEEANGEVLLRQPFIVEGSGNVTVGPGIKILLWGGGAEKTEGKDGDQGPAVFVGWETPTGERICEERTVIRTADNGRWSLLVMPLAGARLDITVRRVA
jgi:hypothetical protein